MTAARAFNHVGMTVPDLDRAIDWYSAVLGFQLIYRRTLGHRPAVPEVREIFGPRFGRARQAHMLGANGVGLELFQFLDPPVVVPQDNFRYYETGIFHFCVTDPDLEGLVARILEPGGRQRTKIWQFLEGRPYRLVYCEDPFGISLRLCPTPTRRLSLTCPVGASTTPPQHDQALCEPSFYVSGCAIFGTLCGGSERRLRRRRNDLSLRLCCDRGQGGGGWGRRSDRGIQCASRSN
jgi:catechol 2,3-dioxygenase-like lactoylglutathione lyase family enzyme